MAEPMVIDLVSDEEEADQISCQEAVLLVFPDICPDHLTQLVSQHNFQPDAVISSILDLQEKGQGYPTRPLGNPLKRKREDDSDASEEDSGGNVKNLKEPEVTHAIRSEIARPDYRPNFNDKKYRDMAKTLLCQDFPKAPVKSIWPILAEKRSLFDAYAFMDEATRNWNEQNRAWVPKKSASKTLDKYESGQIEQLSMDSLTLGEKAAIAEFRAARELRYHKDAKAAAEAEEKANFAAAQRNGETADCGCCYDEQPLNRMAKCNGETVHFFCANCIRQHAETQVGYSKYDLQCMSMDGCSAGFSFSEKKRFLDKNLRTALDRIEQEAMLREAGIESLETCPFCPYAAEYPPAEQDKEFRCERPGCRKVSCRLCRRETHIPKSCAEAAAAAAAEDGLEARRQIEEAMSDALIRKCNKCQNPFVKEAGCNKVTCTRCRTTHCYVCRKTVKDYSHFNDVARGGKNGQCPLFDENDEQRHQDEVQRAELAARQKVVQERPDVDNEALQFKVSEKVREDEKRRKEKGLRHRMMAARVIPPYRPQPGQIPAPAPAPVPAPAPAPVPVPARLPVRGPARAQAPAPAPAGHPVPRVLANAAQLYLPQDKNPVFQPLPAIPPLPFRQLHSFVPGPAFPAPMYPAPFGNLQNAAPWPFRAQDPIPNPAQPNPNPQQNQERNAQRRGWPFSLDLNIDGLEDMVLREEREEVRRPLNNHLNRDKPGRARHEPQGRPGNGRNLQADADQHPKDMFWQPFEDLHDPVLAPPLNPAMNHFRGNGAQDADGPFVAPLPRGNAKSKRSPSVPAQSL